MTDFVKDIETAARNLADATDVEMRLEDERVHHKLAAIDRIMSGGDNQFTSKPHSFSSAESIVNTDSNYQEYLGSLRAAVRDRIIARGNYDAALAAARLQDPARA